MWSFVREWPRRYDKAALVLSVLALIVWIVVPYLALALSFLAAVVLVVSFKAGVPGTGLTRWAALVTLIALVWTAWYAVSAPQ